jgi:zinc protease
MATVPAYDALIEDQLVNRMFGMRLAELMDQPVRPFLGAQAGLRAGPPPPAQQFRGEPRRRFRGRLADDDAGQELCLIVAAGEHDAAKQAVLSQYAEADAERNTSESASLADELGRHFLTAEPVPGIAWENQRVKQLIPALSLEAVNAHARMVLDEPGSQPFVMVAAPSAPGAT